MGRVTLWELVSRPPYPSTIISDPPHGGHLITSIYVDNDGKIVVKYSDVPKRE